MASSPDLTDIVYPLVLRRGQPLKGPGGELVHGFAGFSCTANRWLLKHRKLVLKEQICTVDRYRERLESKDAQAIRKQLKYHDLSRQGSKSDNIDAIIEQVTEEANAWASENDQTVAA